jgi:antitoxin Phd
LASWQLQDAKARFSEFLNATLENGPQIVTRRGVETVVLVPVEQWRSLQQAARPLPKELLLAKTPTFEEIAPKRGQLKRRRVVELA